MKLNKSLFILIWLLGAAIFFLVSTQLQDYIHEGIARLPGSFAPLLGTFKILLFMGSGIYSGTLFITSRIQVHRALFFTVFVIFFVLSFYPLFIYAAPPLMLLLSVYTNFEAFAFIAGLSLFMALYPFKSQVGVGSGKEDPSVTGAQAAETKSGI
ncbi:hypothetical protein [Paenibacillus sp. GbtcB18]|uniref:hypothetical protein n=1 Tax=Paenibacillus sp. GbtcB18 TaxID=2824763 RepID=UPI001C309F1F|nr:hypothetical protein [Paenibacillus sp. GbtcB18]